jgi:hypothetical protein
MMTNAAPESRLVGFIFRTPAYTSANCVALVWKYAVVRPAMDAQTQK